LPQPRLYNYGDKRDVSAGKLKGHLGFFATTVGIVVNESSSKTIGKV